jgi:predicted phosphodiesterase
MRIAIFSDIHGNSIALNAVLADIQRQGGVDEYWVLGDLAALGPDPIGALERLDALPNRRIVRGNTDRYVTRGDRPSPSLQEAQANPALMPVLVEITGAFAWTQGTVTATGWFDWMDALPLELRATLPDGTRFLGVHASPGRDDGDGVHPDLSAEELAALVAGCEADLICVAHTHWPLDLPVENQRVVNLGSVSNPYAPDLRASYVLLEADAAGYRLRHCRADYDRAAVLAALDSSRYPGAAYVSRHLRGDRTPPWRTVAGRATLVR